QRRFRRRRDLLSRVWTAPFQAAAGWGGGVLLLAAARRVEGDARPPLCLPTLPLRRGGGKAARGQQCLPWRGRRCLSQLSAAPCPALADLGVDVAHADLIRASEFPGAVSAPGAGAEGPRPRRQRADGGGQQAPLAGAGGLLQLPEAKLRSRDLACRRQLRRPRRARR